MEYIERIQSRYGISHLQLFVIAVTAVIAPVIVSDFTSAKQMERDAKAKYVSQEAAYAVK